MSVIREKLVELDILRIISILIVVVIIHLPTNYGYNFYDELDDYTGYFLYTLGMYIALGSFAFLSGFGLFSQESNRNINTFDKLFSFIKKRFLRIFPLYWIALIIFIIIFEYTGKNILYLFAHFLGLQIIFAPIFSLPIWTLWFIGLIIVFYLIFIILSFMSSLKKIILTSIVIFLFFMIVNLNFGLVEYRFFLYYFTFIVGIITASIYVNPQYERIKEYLMNKSILIPEIIILLIAIISWVSYQSYTKLFYSTPESIPIGMFFNLNSNFNESIFSILFVDLIIVCYIAFILSIFHLLTRLISLIDNQCYVNKGVSLIAYSTYCVYLFHRPYLAALQEMMLSIFSIDTTTKSNSSLMIFAVLFLFILSFFIQKAADIGLSKINAALNRTNLIRINRKTVTREN
jgi:peptidoglycan/LPS O-acetylase OafA/YrhL